MVYGKPYSEVLDMIRSQPAGTKICFMLERHSAFMKYQFDIVRQPREENVQVSCEHLESHVYARMCDCLCKHAS